MSLVGNKPRLITLAEWQTLTPRQRGYVQYWQGEQPGSQLKDEVNPYEAGSKQWEDYEAGQREAVLDAQDSEE